MKKDMILNILASGINVVVVQLLCYPVLAYIFGSDEFGVILLVMGVVNMIGGLFSISLNNSRLISQRKYSSGCGWADGDFNVLLLALQGVGLIVVLGICLALGLSAVKSILVSVSFFLITYGGYHSVSFRLIIDYKKIVLLNAVRGVGYLLGLAVAYCFNEWTAPFIAGELCGCIFLSRNGHTPKEPMKVTSRFSGTLKDCAMLIWGNLASSIAQYVDRFLLYPVLGAASVSSYTVASYLGKTAGVVANPISSVLLTYFSKETGGVEMRLFCKRVIAMGLFLLIAYACLVFLSEPLLYILYPTIAAEALPYVPLATGGVVVSVFCGFLQPMALSYARLKWQPIIQFTYLGIYMMAAFLLLTPFGLMGFCAAGLIANSYRALLMCCVSLASIRSLASRKRK